MYFLCSCGYQFLEFLEVMLQCKVKLLYIMMIKVCSSSNPCNYIDVGLSQVRALFQIPTNAIKSLSLCILGWLLFSVDDIEIVIFFFKLFTWAFEDQMQNTSYDFITSFSIRLCISL
jgi:hypothetical protein